MLFRCEFNKSNNYILTRAMFKCNKEFVENFDITCQKRGQQTGFQQLQLLVNLIVSPTRFENLNNFVPNPSKKCF